VGRNELEAETPGSLINQNDQGHRMPSEKRSDVTAVQVLAIIAALPKDPENDGTIEPYLDIVLRGLRA
jgi:hypothetical protein